MPKRKVASCSSSNNNTPPASPRRSTRVKSLKWVDNEEVTCGDKVQCLEAVTNLGVISPLKIVPKKKPAPTSSSASTTTKINTKPRSNKNKSTSANSRKRKTTATTNVASSKTSKRRQVSKKKEAPPPPPARKSRNTKGSRPPSKARSVRPPPASSGAAKKRSRRKSSKAEEEEEEEEDDDDANDETNASDDDNDSSGDDDESTNEGNEDDDDIEERQQKEPLYEVGQKVLARDQDGILYQAMIRRKIYGLHHNRQIQVGMVNSQEEIQAMLDEEMSETWHYFVHYFQWNVNWDRWVCQDDILELNDKNIELSQIIIKEHKSLMKEFKQHTRHVDGGAFLNAWQDKLKKLLASQDGTDKGKNNRKKVSEASAKKKRQAAARKKQQALLEKQAQLNSQSLWNRPPIQAQQLVLNYGLKKVLVEEWELISQFNMVHSLPAPKHNTIYSVLQSYLKEMKGIEMKNDDSVYKDKDDAKNKKKEDKAVADVVVATTAEHANEKVAESEEPPPSNANDDSIGKSNNVSDSSDKNTEGETGDNTQEWIDMMNGICMLFDEALPFRLLYPSERAQLQVLEKSFPDIPNSKLYGCEFLLRLFCQLPALLADTYKKKKRNDNNHGENDIAENGDGDYDNDNAAEIIKPIIAKVYDFVRYLQANQSTVFGLNYRKPNQDEIRHQTKMDRKKLRQQQQAAGGAAVAAGSAATAAPAVAG